MYKIFSTCQFVKGYTQDVICDLGRGQYIPVMKEIFELFGTQPFQLEEIAIKYEIEYAVLKELFDMLLHNELVHDCADTTLFPDLNLHWETPYIITNAVIYLSNDLSRLSQLLAINCKHYKIFISSEIELIQLIEYLADKDFLSLKIVLTDATLIIDKNALNELLKNENRISILFASDKYTTSITPDLFLCNIALFTESQKYNTFYNKKIFISPEGYICNDYQFKNSFGHIVDTNILDLVKNPIFTKIWNIHKESIDVCKDCEFRHMCIDPCEPLERLDGTYYRKEECNYNPYISKWKGEIDYKKLEDVGIRCNKIEFKIEDNFYNKNIT